MSNSKISKMRAFVQEYLQHQIVERVYDIESNIISLGTNDNCYELPPIPVRRDVNLAFDLKLSNEGFFGFFKLYYKTKSTNFGPEAFPNLRILPDRDIRTSLINYVDRAVVYFDAVDIIDIFEFIKEKDDTTTDNKNLK